MECNEDYLILNNDEIENQRIFDIFNISEKLFYFELGVSFFLNFFIYIIDVFINDYSLVKIFPGWYNNRLSEIVKGESFLSKSLLLKFFNLYTQSYICVNLYFKMLFIC